MNKNTGIIVGVIVLTAIIGGVYLSKNSQDDAMMVKDQMEQNAMEEQRMAEEKAMMEKKAMEEKGAMMKDDSAKTDSMMKEDETSMVDKGDSMMKAGSYEVYAPEKVTLASADHDVVLFFHASWCPTCRAVDADIKANLSKIPSTLAILDVNYDNSTALKQKYGVTYQHTFVQVDKGGNLIKKWSGSPTLSALVAEVK
ncbi:MAG: thioredoxin family protein [Patescibacteria group bacterium]